MDGAMIDELPKDLIQKIFYLLPTKTVVSTSVLSKEWQFRWKWMQKLKLDSEDYECEDQTFSDVVDHCLHSLPGLEYFHLRFGLDHVHPEDVKDWLTFAFSRNLRKLVIEFLTEPNEAEGFRFTSSLCNNTLETLKIRNLILVDITSPVTMKSLKTLHLSYAFFTNDESITNLLSGCHKLEELVVDRTDEYSVTMFTIRVPSLQRLTIYDENSASVFLGYTIDTPSLKYLTIGELGCPQFSLNAPNLVEATLNDVSSVTTVDFLESLASVKRLVVDESVLQMLYPRTTSVFTQLEYLEMRTCEGEWCDLLIRMLQHSPKLKVLKLVGKDLRYGKATVWGCEWDQPKDVPECLLSHLETFVWKRYDWDKDLDHEEMATYILKNARQLKNATFSTNLIEPNKLKKLSKRRKKLNELAGVVRASDSCRLVFKFEHRFGR